MAVLYSRIRLRRPHGPQLSETTDGKGMERTSLRHDASPVRIDAAQDARARRGRRVAFFERRSRAWRDALLRRMLAIGDLGAAICVSLSFVYLPGGAIDLAFWSLVFAPCWVLLAKLHGLYDGDQRTLRHLTVDEVPVIFFWALTGTASMGLFLWTASASPPSLAAAVPALAVAAGAAVILRGFARFLWRRIVPRERAVIIGSGPIADATRRKLELFPDIHVDVVDQLDERLILDSGRSSLQLADIDRVILASQAIDEPLIASLLTSCRRAGVKLSVIPPARGMFGTAARLNHVAELPVLEYNTWEVSRSTLLLKRAMDVAVSVPALVLLAPVFALVGLAIRIDTRGPVFFRQARAGLHGRRFTVVKFRTMIVNAEAKRESLVRLDDLSEPVFKLRGDPRVTRVGRLLRRFSLDEFPQLINVAKGDMSLVGPRPELLELVGRWPPEHRFRLSVKPGVTGPMQVFGRSELRFDEWLAVERDYIENLSIGRDLRILALTLPTVVTGRGAF